MGSLAYIVIIIVMLLWIMRSNKKNQQQAQKLQDSLKPGMYVMLKDGLYGTIVDVTGDDVVINFSVDGADEGCLTVSRTGIYNVIDDSAAAQGAQSSENAPKLSDTGNSQGSQPAPGSIEERLKRLEQLDAEEENAERNAGSEDDASEADGSGAGNDNIDGTADDITEKGSSEEAKTEQSTDSEENADAEATADINAEQSEDASGAVQEETQNTQEESGREE